MLQIRNFTESHVEQAMKIALCQYDEERKHVPAMPKIVTVPDIRQFAENNLGVAAFIGEEMVGFLCSVTPFQKAFNATDVTGVFSPMGANGAIGEHRAEIYARLYQVAGEKWVLSQAVSHAICLYAHDKVGQEQFFRYGFGRRTVDALRGMKEFSTSSCIGYTFEELPENEYTDVFPLELRLNSHLAQSPFFTCREPQTLENFIHAYEESGTRFFVAKQEGEICAFFSLLHEGENFIADLNDTIQINTAYCLPDHRGKGVPQALLNVVISILREEGYTRLGVDYESINPVAYNFWCKYFEPYTYGLVRRIDEHIISICN